MKERIIAIAADHGGYELKEIIKEHLEKNNIKYVDFGTNSSDSCDYPDYARPACNAVQNGECECAILVCGTGIGMSLAANKCHGIRAACCSDTFSVRMTRLHNNANALCLGARVIGPGLALDMVELFLCTEFEGDRHQKRIDLVAEIEAAGK